ncbi:MAG: stage III sporulation protein SpoIIIAB [Desulfotomaculaceae bacterium]|nr:stage III sporulation protein SpoIIIAB [Desulfotomaculaceae bacterium]MDD4766915.1 stage III sporulation protein SpoIIIAB [Desulfotomaculaceae bacterium]
MIKLLGAAMVVASSGIGGMTVAGRYSRRPRELKSLGYALQMLETEISYGANQLKVALEQVANRCDKVVAPLFSRAAAELSAATGITAAAAWENSLCAYYRKSALNPQDLIILRSLGSSLGISDRADQVKHLNLAMEQIKSENTKAEDEAARNVKLWNHLGFLGGLLVVLILY